MSRESPDSVVRMRRIGYVIYSEGEFYCGETGG